MCLNPKLARWLAISLLAFAACPAHAKEHNGLRYVLVADPQAGASQTLDLLLPETAGKAPLLVLVAHELWMPQPGGRLSAHTIAREMQQRGVAVAVVRHRQGPVFRQMAAVEDLASAIRFLAASAARYGFDSEHIFLMGYFAGAFDALDLVLDPNRDELPGIAGVISVDGILELERKYTRHEPWRKVIDAAFGADPSAWKGRTPRQWVRADAPPILLLNSAAGGAGQLAEAQDFLFALRHAGHPAAEFFAMTQRDRASILHFGGQRNLVREIVLSFMGVPTSDPETRASVALQRRWQNPPFDSREFWKRGAERVRTHAVTAALRADLKQALERFASEEFATTPLAEYHAINLADWLEIPGAVSGTGDYLSLTNVRGERFYLSTQQVRKYQPQLVIGIDQERNLFRYLAFYQTRRQYSWKDAPEPVRSARPLGAFLHFPGPVPDAVRTNGIARFGLLAGGIERHREDPFGSLAGLPEVVLGALYYRNGCVSCHVFRGFSARSHHVVATNGEVQGGFAEPLVSYPDAVLKRFFYTPREAARIIGVEPNIVVEQATDPMYRLISAEKKP
ncbi:MAG: alpha/beta hydrolase [Gammaproteobacteria bacterium]|jgi:acetyl esterase/lipase|nr:alpha/beta hydrolase [Gammaproteobacteria bacterium]